MNAKNIKEIFKSLKTAKYSIFFQAPSATILQALGGSKLQKSPPGLFSGPGHEHSTKERKQGPAEWQIAAANSTGEAQPSTSNKTQLIQFCKKNISY